jgi:hypothetical protein
MGSNPAAVLAAVLGVVLAAAMAACSPLPTASQPPGLVLTDADVEPLQHEAAAIEMAFDADAAAALVEAVPAGLDFGAQALVCVYLGVRPTTGWGLALQSASLEGGELRILARETRPGGGSRQALTYPADCGLLTRAALPAGSLAVRADDTISAEFIVAGTVSVPAASATQGAAPYDSGR